MLVRWMTPPIRTPRSPNEHEGHSGSRLPTKPRFSPSTPEDAAKSLPNLQGEALSRAPPFRFDLFGAQIARQKRHESGVTTEDQYRRKGWAERHWKSWYFWATPSRLEPVIEVARTLKRHLPGRLSYFAQILGIRCIRRCDPTLVRKASFSGVIMRVSPTSLTGVLPCVGDTFSGVRR